MLESLSATAFTVVCVVYTLHATLSVIALHLENISVLLHLTLSQFTILKSPLLMEEERGIPMALYQSLNVLLRYSAPSSSKFGLLVALLDIVSPSILVMADAHGLEPGHRDVVVGQAKPEIVGNHIQAFV